MKKKPKSIQILKPQIYLLTAGLVLFAICVVIARSNIAGNEERSIVNAIYNLPSWLAPIMFVVTLWGSTFMALAVAVWSYFCIKKKTAVYLFLAIVVTYVTVVGIKHILDMPRPFEIDGKVINRELFVAGSAFPSGHTAMATVLALGLYPVVATKYRSLLIIWIIGVAFSRIYLGVHGLIDVIAGFAIGLTINQVLTIYRHKR